MKPLFIMFLLVVFATVTASLLLTSCSSDDDPAAPTPPQLTKLSGTVGIAGGSLVSSDGKLTLTIPQGALTADTNIKITEIEADQASSVFDGLVIEKAFDVEPIGLEFTADVEISLTLDLLPPSTKISAVETPQIEIETRFFATSDNIEDHPKFLNTKIEVGNNRKFTTSFSQLTALIVAAIGPQQLWIKNQMSMPENVMLHRPFETMISLVVCSMLLMDTSPRFYYSANSFTFEIEDGGTMTADTETTATNGDVTSTYGVQTTPNEPGAQNIAWAVWILVRPETDAFASLLLPPDVELPTIEIKYTMDPQPITVADEEPITGSPPVGVYAISLSLPESMTSFHKMTEWQHGSSIAVGHHNGVSFYGLNTTPPLQEVNNDFVYSGDQRFGCMVMKYSFKNTKSTGYKILLFGPNGGASSGWVPENNGFGMTQIFAFDQNLTDAQPYDNDPGSIGYCYVNNTGGIVHLVEFNSSLGYFQGAGTVYSFPDATGNAVSAFARQGESLLTVVDGTPGRLYQTDLDNIFEPATYIADLGNSPRRIRSAADVAVVSNYESDSLTIISWSQADEVSIVETVAVGDGPVGIDLLELPSGNIAIVSTGFNDNSYCVTVVEPAGTLISTTQYTLPAGITGPGHAIWLHDHNDRILISGNTTGNLAVVASGL